MKAFKWTVLILIPIIIFSATMYMAMLKIEISKQNQILMDNSGDYIKKSFELVLHHKDDMENLLKDTILIPEMSVENLKTLNEKYIQLHSDYSDYIEIMDKDFIVNTKSIDESYLLVHKASIIVLVIIVLTIIELLLIAFTLRQKKKV